MRTSWLSKLLLPPQGSSSALSLASFLFICLDLPGPTSLAFLVPLHPSCYLLQETSGLSSRNIYIRCCYLIVSLSLLRVCVSLSLYHSLPGFTSINRHLGLNPLLALSNQIDLGCCTLPPPCGQDRHHNQPRSGETSLYSLHEPIPEEGLLLPPSG